MLLCVWKIWNIFERKITFLNLGYLFCLPFCGPLNSTARGSRTIRLSAPSVYAPAPTLKPETTSWCVDFKVIQEL